MSSCLRKNVWDANNGGQFQDQSGNYTDLYWYAKAVQTMQEKPISDPTSWWFYAAIHGQYLIETIKDPRYKYLNWKNISYIALSADLGNLPTKTQTDLFWNQCQHGTWYFGPWHRGYLVALEVLLRDIIIDLGGSADWALPYWNYLNQSTKYQEYTIPPAFTLNNLPDGTLNPLFVPERYGPDGDGKIYIDVGTGDGQINDECQWDTVYTSSSFDNEYGGKKTGFSHDNDGFGGLESNPHNGVHGEIGGTGSSNNQLGIMGVPATAALDPIFYLHHANIDRMWAAWNETGKNANPTNQNWLTGPTSGGNSRFAMPVDNVGTPWYYTPEDVGDLNKLTYKGKAYIYSYDDLSLTSYNTTPPTAKHEKVLNRLKKLGTADLEKEIQMADKKKSELVGASSSALKLTGKKSHKASVKFDKPSWKSVENSFLKASPSSLPDEVYLLLEDVKGAHDANFISLYINDQFIKSVSLFGLGQSSLKGGSHSSSGVTYKFNITEVIDKLHIEDSIDFDSLDVELKTKRPLPEGEEITVSRIGIYKVSQ